MGHAAADRSAAADTAPPPAQDGGGGGVESGRRPGAGAPVRRGLRRDDAGRCLRPARRFPAALAVLSAVLASAALLAAGGHATEGLLGGPLESKPYAPERHAWPSALLPAAFADHYIPCLIPNAGSARIEELTFVQPSGLYKINDTITIKAKTFLRLYEYDFLHTRLELATGDGYTLAMPSHIINSQPDDGHYYNYTVQPGDYSDDLDYRNASSLYWMVGTSATLGTYTQILEDTDGNGIDCQLSNPGTSSYNNLPSLSVSGDVVVDGIVPRVANVTVTPPGGMYAREGDSVLFNATFSEAVVYSGAEPSLRLDLGGGATRNAGYEAGNGTNVLTFNYTVQDGDTASNVEYNGTTALTPAGSLTDLAGNEANLTLSPSGSLGHPGAIRVDAAAPTVLSVFSPNGTGPHAKGSVIAVMASLSEDVNVVAAGSAPSIALATGAAAGSYAVYNASTSTARTLAFSYTVTEGDDTADLDYTNTTALSAGGWTMRDAAGNDADLALADPDTNDPLGSSGPIRLDAVRPTVDSVSSTTRPGPHGIGSPIDVRVALSENVTVDYTGGRPSIALATGAALGRHAEYNASASTGRLLVFSYNVTAGDNTASLDYAGTGALDLNGSAIADEAGNSANTTLPDPGTDGLLGALMPPIELDTAAPTVSSASSPNGTGTYGIGKRIAIGVNFTETVLVEGAPVLYMETGDADRPARYAAGNDSETLTFLYTVREGDNSTDLDYANATALALNGSTIRDAAGNDANTTLPDPAGDGLPGPSGTIRLDAVRPTVDSVSSTTPSGPHGIGSPIDVRVAFSENVTVDDTGGRPSISLATGAAAGRHAEYNASASAGRLLVFSYNVTAGDNTASLDYAGTGALNLNGSVIADAAGNSANTALPDPAGDGLLGALMPPIELDTAAPTVSSASSPNGTGTYGIGKRIAIGVNFTETVLVEGAPVLYMETGDADRPARYAAGNDSETLTFLYTVREGDNSTDLDYANATALALNGSTIRDAAGNDANTTLPDPGGDGLLAGAGNPIRIDTEVAGVLRVDSGTPDGAYMAGAEIDVKIVFSKAVLVEGTPFLALDAGETDRPALYDSGNDSETLTFLYTVREMDNSADLGYANATALALNGSTIRDAAGNNANTTLPAPGHDGSLAYSKGIVVDTTDPSVSSVSSPNATGAYMAGERIAISVTFGEPVFVAGMPLLELGLDGNGAAGQAGYDSGNGSETLTFVYAVRDGDNTSNLDYAGTDALDLNGSAIEDAAGNSANTTLPDPGTDDGLRGALMPIAIDTDAPAVSSTSSPNGTGTYGIGKRIAIGVDFTETVLVEGTPVLYMETGDTDRQARYVAGNDSGTLTFLYTVRALDNATDLDYNGTDALALADGSTIRDAAGNNANTTLPPPGDDGLLAGAGNSIRIDTPEAGVLRVTSGTPDGAYMAGEAIDVKVVFTENVTVGGTGMPLLALETGETDRQALYDSGSGSAALTFLYTVRDGDSSADLNYANETALTLNGSTIRDAAGSNATLILPPPGELDSLAGSKDIAIDTAAPTVLSVSSPNGTGTYGTGDRIVISIVFTETVLVEGAPVLALETGETDRQALYDSGSGSAALTFLYTVRDGDNSAELDYASATALTLGDGSFIRDAAGNNANTTLPDPGTDGLLAGAGNPIRIDTGGAPVAPAREDATVVSAVFTARNTATIAYSVGLDRPDGYEGPVYESVSVEGGYTVRIAPGNVTGLGSATHRIAFAGAGVDSSQAGTISLVSELVGTTSNGTVLWFNDTTVSVAPGETVRVVGQHEPPRPGAPPPPAVAIERDGFTRAVNATGAGSGTRVAINVTGLAVPLPPPGAPPAINVTAAWFPAEPVRLIAAFAEVTFPPNATASPVPAAGLIALYASDDVPPASDIAAALGLAGAESLRVRQLVEIGDNATHIAFDAPVRILLVGQAGGSGAFYVNITDGAVVPIDVRCDADSVEAAARQLAGGAGECWIDLPGNGAGASGGKVIYTYHLTRFGTAAAAESPPPAADTPAPVSVSVLQRPGGEPLRASASYAEGQSITVAVDFSAPVSVGTAGGTPRLLLETGSAGAAAPYDSGNGTDRLEFAYAVRGGDITGRLSYAGTDALDLGGGSISAAAAGSGPSVDASLALPPPGSLGSLSDPDSPAARIDPIGRPVLDVGILDEGGAGAGHVSRAAYIAAAEFNERQGRADGALLINATSYDAGGTAADGPAAAAAAALRSAYSAGGAGPSVYVGPSTDRGLHAAMPYAADNGIILVSAGSTAPSLAVADDRTFRLLPSDRLEAEALARLAYSGGDELVHVVLDNATYGPPYGSGRNGGLADADLPPPQGAFAHAFGAALASAAISTLSGTVTLAGGGGTGTGTPYDGAAAAEALDASVRSAAATGARPASVVYLGSPEGLAALAEGSASYPSLASASWLASGLSAGSGLLAGDGAAAGFAASSGLSAARWSPPASAAGQEIDSMLPGLGPGERNSAYAAYDAVIVVGEAAVAAAAGSSDAPDAAAIAGALPAAAAAHDGALGDIALDYAGDLWVPAQYDLWTVEQPGGAAAGTAAEWSRQQGALDGERSCSIALTRAKIDYGPIDSGQTSRPHLQTIVNTGQLAFARVDLTATPWHVDSPGSCEPGVEPSLPVGLSEIRTVQGGAFSDLAGSGVMLAQGLEPGSRAPLWYRLSLAGYADLPQAEITQCATYVVRCS